MDLSERMPVGSEGKQKTWQSPGAGRPHLLRDGGADPVGDLLWVVGEVFSEGEHRRVAGAGAAAR